VHRHAFGPRGVEGLAVPGVAGDSISVDGVQHHGPARAALDLRPDRAKRRLNAIGERQAFQDLGSVIGGDLVAHLFVRAPDLVAPLEALERSVRALRAISTPMTMTAISHRNSRTP